ncbi:uncharacterized protein Z519_03317 [Cladophialophora bantiana CBS 173.52]|uniref:Glycoside hydrolase family 2 immunoglobulin-like beta-sandwich domain-containing protein n=1 Tax=Cladophialophora bantiana (strain ATCC 10958 / CBS 173.52 / CDC B-1940 / NIH 8579) TaxID=1442370 RepID=A0A0D2IHQ2_CLAB1|nr:uncharacterized protein Z519_03317 [Cladophialophora bantiana CBS 173.52]KIW96249.1 hypothetical protein Z519_03317 [Cladophialophora bantiana CBS 173.52]
MSKTFGIRKVELIQRPLPGQEGVGFFFKINHVPIFAAGSSWIPADSFLSRISTQKYRDRIKLVRDSNEVMIRVWGGGVREHESFYHPCDQLGGLVWQDFMFAYVNFQAHAQLRNRVAVKAEQDVRRSRRHPSIVLWCGNNEDYIIPPLRQLEYDSSEIDPGKILESPFPASCVQENGDVSEDKSLKWHNKMEDGGDRIARYRNDNIKFETGSLPVYIYSTQLI